MPSDDRECAFSSRVCLKAAQIKVPYKLWHYQYLKIGWKWVRYALSRCDARTTSLSLSSEPDPEPAMASIKQAQKRQQQFAFEYEEVA